MSPYSPWCPPPPPCSPVPAWRKGFPRLFSETHSLLASTPVKRRQVSLPFRWGVQDLLKLLQFLFSFHLFSGPSQACSLPQESGACCDQSVSRGLDTDPWRSLWVSELASNSVASDHPGIFFNLCPVLLAPREIRFFSSCNRKREQLTCGLFTQKSSQCWSVVMDSLVQNHKGLILTEPCLEHFLCHRHADGSGVAFVLFPQLKLEKI